MAATIGAASAGRTVEDQQLGGLIMWVPGSLAYVGVALVLLVRWIARATSFLSMAAPTKGEQQLTRSPACASSNEWAGTRPSATKQVALRMNRALRVQLAQLLRVEQY